jgi:hypothetical protein
VAPDDYRLGTFAAHAADQILSVDGTLWRTLRALLARPGLLTAEYLAGRRTRYARPLQLFLLVNVAFFLATGALGTFRFRLAQYEQGRVGTYALRDTARVRALVAAKARREGTTAADVARRFDDASAAQQSVWLAFVPLLGAAIAGLYARRRLPYVQHLVFASHYLAFVLVAMAGSVAVVYGVFAGAGRLLPALAGAPAAARALRGLVVFLAEHERWSYAPLAWVTAYLALALRRVYHDAWPWAAARALLLGAFVVALTNLYRDLLFFVTYLSV